MLLDRIQTVHVVSLPVSPLSYDGGGFVIGFQSLTFGGTNNLRWDIELTSDSANCVWLQTSGGRFPMGTRTNPVDPSGRPEITFAADAGDAVTLTSSQSMLAWPTPFEISFLTSTPSWRRFVYYDLLWKKPSGARLAMHWRYEQQYFARSGWKRPEMEWNYRTGLLSVDFDHAIVRYISRTKGWRRSDYRIERRGDNVYAVIHADDERNPTPGAGKSVELHLDPRSHEVIKELGGQ